MMDICRRLVFKVFALFHLLINSNIPVFTKVIISVKHKEKVSHHVSSISVWSSGFPFPVSVCIFWVVSSIQIRGATGHLSQQNFIWIIFKLPFKIYVTWCQCKLLRRQALNGTFRATLSQCTQIIHAYIHSSLRVMYSNRLNTIIKKASQVLGVELDSVFQYGVKEENIVQK